MDEGQTVNASQSAPTSTIAGYEDLARMQVEANIDEADIGQVRRGQDGLQFTVDAFPRNPSPAPSR